MMKRMRFAALLLMLLLLACPAGVSAERIDQIFTDPMIAATVARGLHKETSNEVTQSELQHRADL